MNNTPFTTSPGYRVEIHGSPGRCAIKSPRGLVAIMEAGNADTREKDAARIVATVEAFPRVLAALKEAEKALCKALPFCPADGEAHYVGKWLGEVRAAIALAEGRAQ